MFGLAQGQYRTVKLITASSRQQRQSKLHLSIVGFRLGECHALRPLLFSSALYRIRTLAFAP